MNVRADIDRKATENELDFEIAYFSAPSESVNSDIILMGRLEVVAPGHRALATSFTICKSDEDVADDAVLDSMESILRDKHCSTTHVLYDAAASAVRVVGAQVEAHFEVPSTPPGDFSLRDLRNISESPANESKAEEKAPS